MAAAQQMPSSIEEQVGGRLVSTTPLDALGARVATVGLDACACGGPEVARLPFVELGINTH